MRKFIIKTMIVVVSWLLPLYILQFLYDKTAQQVYDRWPYDKINMAFEKPQNADLVIMGNSRGTGNYIPQILDSILEMKCCNLSLSGYPFNFNYNMVFQPYIKRNSLPRFIIQDVGPFAFFQDFNPIYRIEFLPYINRPEFGFYLKRCSELSEFYKFLPLKYHGQLSLCIDNFRSFILEEGDKPEWNYYRVGSNYSGKDIRPLEKDSDILKLFAQYLEDCKALNIKVVLICSPIHMKDGYSHFDMKGFKEMMTDIARKEEMPFLDYSDYYGADTLFFIDAMHLKKPAQKQFSRQVAADLKAMGWSLDSNMKNSTSLLSDH